MQFIGVVAKPTVKLLLFLQKRKKGRRTIEFQYRSEVFAYVLSFPYLDIVQRLKQQTLLPIASYQVSGEYSAIKFASKAGALNEKDVVFESIMGFKRAGASLIVTYFAKQIAIWLKE